MRNSILGFNQAYAASLYKVVEKSGKEVTLKLDVNDLTILRWLVDFSHTGKMETISMDGKLFYWVSYNKVIEDLPLLNIGKDMLYRRLKKMVELDILTYYSKSGGQAYFGFGSNYASMLSSEYVENSEGSEKIPSVLENNPSNLGKNSVPTSEKNPTNRLLNNSQLDKTLNNKKESKKDNYDAIVDDNFSDDKVKSTLIEFIKMRKLIKKPLTDFALKKICNALKRLSSDPVEQVAILEQSIINNWQGLFPLKTNNNYSNSNNQSSGNYDFVVESLNKSREENMRDYTEEELANLNF